MSFTTFRYNSKVELTIALTKLIKVWGKDYPVNKLVGIREVATSTQNLSLSKVYVLEAKQDNLYEVINVLNK